MYYPDMVSWNGTGAPWQVVLTLGKVPEKYDTIFLARQSDMLMLAVCWSTR